MRRALPILSLLLILTLTPTAQAASDPVGGGQATLRLSPAFLSFLRKDGIKLSVGAPAKLKVGPYRASSQNDLLLP